LLVRTHTLLQNSVFVHRLDDRRHSQWGSLKRRASGLLRTTETTLLEALTRLVLLYPFSDKESSRERISIFLHSRLKRFKNMTPQRKWELLFFRPLEAFNASWLVYIVVAQTWGFYKTCDCVTSNWGGAGGYLDFGVQDLASPWVARYWITGTLVASSVLGISMFYITVEWCQQSFLSTEDYEGARHGLRMTRMYRHATFSFRRLSRLLSLFTFHPMERLAVAIGLLKYQQKTLLWTKAHTHNPDMAVLATQTPRPHARPSIELSDFSSDTTRDASPHSHVTYKSPAMAHSLSPLAIPQRRPRHDSDSSAAQPSPYLLYGSPTFFPALSTQPSHESGLSTAPLLQRPTDAHMQQARVGSGASVASMSFPEYDEPRSSGEEGGIASPVSPARVGEYTPFSGVVQSRLAYARASSESGWVDRDALGIRMSGDMDVERGESK
jgi:hypothetical protein